MQLLASADLPVAPSAGFTHTEAPDLLANYLPDTASSNFTGKTFTIKSGSSGTSGHATTVATYFYGNTTSLVTGNIPVDLYNANGWIGSNFLRTGGFNAPATESRSVQNHSWIAETYSSATEAGKRLDYAINRDGFVCVVGENNGNSTVLPELLGQSYHTISVGLVNGSHSAGFTTLDGTGRIKPDIVAPESATSFATPMVSSAAGLLYSKLTAAPYSLTGADKPRVIKALLLASATKDTVASWANTSARPLDLRYGAGELNIYHAYSDLRAGPGIASDTALQKTRGWSAETLNAHVSKSYYFTIPAGTPPTPFSAALIWHRSLSGFFPNLSSSLANLELHLYHATGFSTSSIIADSTSPVDNVELIHQSSLSPGTYAVVVENTSNTSTPYALAWHTLPAVSITASAPIAREIDLLQAAVTITRTGDTTLALFVPLSVVSSAIANTDYQSLPAQVIIPAGQASTTLPIIPIADDLAQGNRSMTIGIAGDFALVRDAMQTAAITIEDKPFDAWRFAHFNAAELNDPSISGSNSDPDGDQLANLIEYALGFDPGAPNISPAVAAQNSGHLSLSTSKNADATDVTWSAEVSDNLSSWSPAVIVSNTSTAFAARDSILSSSATRRMIRLKITRP